MGKVLETLTYELRGIRTGRASSAILESIRVDCYGQTMPINQLGNITIPQPRLIEIKLWDENSVQPTEKAIISSNLGFTPSIDGNVIRIQVPSLTSERREELIKSAHIIVENFRVEIRNIRRNINEEIKKIKKSSEISEDEAFKSLDRVQKETDKHIELISNALTKKEKEIREE